MLGPVALLAGRNQPWREWVDHLTAGVVAKQALELEDRTSREAVLPELFLEVAGKSHPVHLQDWEQRFAYACRCWL